MYADLQYEFEKLYVKINEYNVLKDSGISTNFLSSLVKASFVKQVEFIHSAFEQEDSNIFFFLPGLRSNCEDYIVLTYFDNENLDNDIIRLIIQVKTYESIEAQSKYFESGVTDQKKVNNIFTEDVYSKYKSDIRKYFEGKKIKLNNYSQYPSTRKMALTIDEESFYNFVFHGTSKAVHFSPHILLRMAWGNDNEDNRYLLSTGNFNLYYKSFVLYYSIYIPLKYYHRLSKYLFEVDERVLFQIQHVFSKISFLPEIVTFSEMNLNRPKDVVTSTKTRIKKMSEYFRGMSNEEIKDFVSKLTIARDKLEQ